MIKYLIVTDYIHVHVLVSSILIYTLIPKDSTLVMGLNMDHLMPLRYVSFSYLSKVKSGGKVVHWTLTLSQDSCSCYEPMHPTYFCLAHIFK